MLYILLTLIMHDAYQLIACQMTFKKHVCFLRMVLTHACMLLNSTFSAESSNTVMHCLWVQQCLLQAAGEFDKV